MKILSILRFCLYLLYLLFFFFLASSGIHTSCRRPASALPATGLHEGEKSLFIFLPSSSLPAAFRGFAGTDPQMQSCPVCSSLSRFLLALLPYLAFRHAHVRPGVLQQHLPQACTNRQTISLGRPRFEHKEPCLDKFLLWASRPSKTNAAGTRRWNLCC